MTLWLVLNEETLGPGSGKSDVQVLADLAHAFDALRKAAMAYEQGRLRACVPDDNLYGQTLPGGSSFGATLRDLKRQDQVAHGVLQGILSRMQSRETVDAEPGARTGVARLGNEVIAAVQATWRHDGVLWSADRAGCWRKDRIAVAVSEENGATRPDVVYNLWSKREITSKHRRQIAARGLVAVPDYEDDGRHNPEGATTEQRNNYLKYKGQKSELPRSADALLRRALPIKDRVCYWALCAHGFYHRFQGSLREDAGDWPVVHWNGTTDPRALGNRWESERTTEADVPAAVREELKRLGPTEDCNCRLMKE